MNFGLDATTAASIWVLIGLLIFLGLLGTFWGLLETVSSVGDVIAGLSVQGDASVVFDDLKRGLGEPLSGMGIAFSSSLFGLSGSLILGFLDLQTGQAQNAFYTDLEDWMSTITELDLEVAEVVPLDGADQAVDLQPLEQQLAGTHGLGHDMGRDRGQGLDLGPEQEQLAAVDYRVAVAEVDPAGAQALDLPTFQDQAGFQAFFDVVFVTGPFVQGNRAAATFLAGLVGHGFTAQAHLVR